MSGGVRVCRLDGRQRSKRAVLTRLASDLRFPPHFGNNLDALNDALAIDTAGPIRIEWRITQSARAALGADLPSIIEAIDNAASERSDFDFQRTYADR